jgi:hypothetical protein
VTLVDGQFDTNTFGRSTQQQLHQPVCDQFMQGEQLLVGLVNGMAIVPACMRTRSQRSVGFAQDGIFHRFPAISTA